MIFLVPLLLLGSLNLSLPKALSGSLVHPPAKQRLINCEARSNGHPAQLIILG